MMFFDIFGARQTETKQTMLTNVPIEQEKPNTLRNVERIDSRGRCWFPFWRPLDFERAIRFVFLDGFGVTEQMTESSFFDRCIAIIGKCKRT